MELFRDFKIRLLLPHTGPREEESARSLGLRRVSIRRRLLVQDEAEVVNRHHLLVVRRMGMISGPLLCSPLWMTRKCRVQD
jgi:hypothetical protein